MGWLARRFSAGGVVGVDSILRTLRASTQAAGLGVAAALFACGSQDESANRAVKPPEAVVEFAIEDLVLGGGAECLSANPIVTIQYRGMLLDGREFDSSYERGAPIVAPLDSLIPGWRQGIPGMKVGGKRRLTVPADLAYSGMAAVQASDAGGSAPSGKILIPPDSTLVFEIELLALSSAEDPAAEAELARRARE